MTMAPTRSHTERPPRTAETPDDPELSAPDAAEAPEAAPESAGPTDTPRAGFRGVRTWRPSARLLWILATLLVVAAVAVTATAGRAAWQQQRGDDGRAAALAAGRQIAVNFVTMSASTFDADTKRVLDEATGTFAKEYASTLAQLKPVVTANKTVSTVERAEAALVSGDEDSAKVIVGVVAPTSNASTPKPEKKTYRLRLDLVKVGDAWKVSTLDFVS